MRLTVIGCSRSSRSLSGQQRVSLATGLGDSIPADGKRTAYAILPLFTPDN
jgi:hypothetical protein